MTLKIDAKFKEKVTFALKNDMRNLANIHRLKSMNSNPHKKINQCLDINQCLTDISQF